MAEDSSRKKRKESGVFYNTPASSSDRLFAYFIKYLFIILVLFGAGMMIVILWGPVGIGVKMVSAFSTMFAGALGLGGGYLLGKRNGG